jgi:transcriptional regulator with XRE-family HTH domain
MARSNPASSPQKYMGDELRRARLAAGFSSQDALARRIGFDRTTVNRAESGDRVATPELLEAWGAACGIDVEMFARMATMARTAGGAYPGWFTPWAGIEAEAVKLRWFELTVVPGLLQTESYARSLLAGRLGFNGNLDEAVSARMARQSILTRQEPPELFVVIDEAALHRPIGSPDVMAGQLSHLAEPPGRTIVQVIPQGTGNHDGIQGSFIVAELSDGSSAAYVESAMRGMVVQEGTDVAELVATWDRLTAEALPRTASVSLMRGVMETWKA